MSSQFIVVLLCFSWSLLICDHCEVRVAPIFMCESIFAFDEDTSRDAKRGINKREDIK